MNSFQELICLYIKTLTINLGSMYFSLSLSIFITTPFFNGCSWSPKSHLENMCWWAQFLIDDYLHDNFRLRLPRSWFSVSNATPANTVSRFPSRGLSTSSWEVTRRGRARWSSSNNLFHFLLWISLSRLPSSCWNKI